MKLETAHFGVIDINKDDIIYFPEGIPGFEASKKYALIGNDGEDAIFFWLQSADQPDCCFVVTDPFLIYNNYGIDIDDEDVDLLEIKDADKVLTLAIAVIPEDIKETRINLKAPLIINIESKLGKQVIQRSDTLPVRYYLNQK